MDNTNELTTWKPWIDSNFTKRRTESGQVTYYDSQTHQIEIAIDQSGHSGAVCTVTGISHDKSFKLFQGSFNDMCLYVYEFIISPPTELNYQHLIKMRDKALAANNGDIWTVSGYSVDPCICEVDPKTSRPDVANYIATFHPLMGEALINEILRLRSVLVDVYNSLTSTNQNIADIVSQEITYQKKTIKEALKHKPTSHKERLQQACETLHEHFMEQNQIGNPITSIGMRSNSIFVGVVDEKDKKLVPEIYERFQVDVEVTGELQVLALGSQ